MTSLGKQFLKARITSEKAHARAIVDLKSMGSGSALENSTELPQALKMAILAANGYREAQLLKKDSESKPTLICAFQNSTEFGPNLKGTQVRSKNLPSTASFSLR